MAMRITALRGFPQAGVFVGLSRLHNQPPKSKKLTVTILTLSTSVPLFTRDWFLAANTASVSNRRMLIG